MISYDTDPSLHAAQPAPVQLDDGFSPPPHDKPAAPRDNGRSMAPEADPAPWVKSAF